MEHLDHVIVREPTFVEALAACWPTSRWTTGATGWPGRSCTTGAVAADERWIQANFDFYGTTLRGVPELRERWKRGVELVRGRWREAVGQLYVAAHFPPEDKAAHGSSWSTTCSWPSVQRLEDLEWMSPETRAQGAGEARHVHARRSAIPTSGVTTPPLEISADDLVGNVRRAGALRARHELGKLGGPVDRDEWFMTPQTVNAYYNPGMNEIVFPAAILQPPFFDLEADDAVNYGAIGAVIGHEIGHGFDDQGVALRRRRATSRLVDRRGPRSLRRTARPAGRPVRRPHAPLASDAQVNGELTVGENIGDLGWLSVAFGPTGSASVAEASPVIDGLTGEQRFFLGWAQVWRSKHREARAIRLLTIDPHSPDEFRCNIVSQPHRVP